MDVPVAGESMSSSWERFGNTGEPDEFRQFGNCHHRRIEIQRDSHGPGKSIFYRY